MPVKNVRELKSQLRAKHKKIRKSCPPEKKQQLDLALQNAFLASEEYKSCDVLFAFVSSPIEVDTSLILETKGLLCQSVKIISAKWIFTL